MKKVRKLALLMIFILACTFGQQVTWGANDASNEVLTSRSGVLQVNVGIKEKGSSDDAEIVSGGSGFLIGNDDAQYVLTNYHVIDATNAYLDKAAKYYHINKDNYKTVLTVTAIGDVQIEAEIVQKSEQYDIAILKLANSIGGVTPLTLSSKENVSETDAVYALGFPGIVQYNSDKKTYTSDDVTTESGTISKFDSVKGVNYIMHNATLTEGNSGGPLVDANGYVIGINQAKMESGSSSYSYSIQIDVVRSILDKLNIGYSSSDGSSTQPESEVEDTTEATVDKSELQAAISSANQIVESKYEADSYKAFEEKLDEAKSVENNSSATQNEVTKATDDLISAQKALEEKSNIMMFVIIGVIIVAVIILAIFIISRGKKKEKSASATETDNVPSVPNVPLASGSIPTPQPMPSPYEDNGNGFVNDGIGETDILNEGAGETTLLSNQNVPQASLFRNSNREDIKINKSNFSIGKERRKVDYCISDNSSISRSHAEIIIKNGIFYIIDKKSTNGTYVNGVRLNPLEERELNSGDKVKLSDEEFEFKQF